MLKKWGLVARILDIADQLNAVEAFINIQTNTGANRGKLYAVVARNFKGMESSFAET